MRLKIVELPANSVTDPMQFIVYDTDVGDLLGSFVKREDAKTFVNAKLYQGRTLQESASRSPVNGGEEDTYPTYTVSTTDVN